MTGDASQRGRRLLATLEPGSYVSGYRLESPIGAGGMAAVFRAHDEALDRLVALKLVYAGPGIDQVIRERFVREALSIAKVDHPNIIPVYAAGESDDMLFIAMRYIDGTDLGEYVGGAERPEARWVHAVVAQVAAALDAAHRRGLVHRDVKPANVIIGDDGRVRLLDLGLVGAKQQPEPGDSDRLTFDSTSSMDRIEGPLTMSGERLGTPAYMSREQFLGLQLTPASDIFAFSVVLYEALFDMHPFMAESFQDLQTNVVENRVALPHSSGVPIWLARQLAPPPAATA